MRVHLLISAVVLSCIFFTVPSQAHANWVEFFFPMLKDTSNDPANTLRAPFAEPDDESSEGDAAKDDNGETAANAEDQNPSNETVPLRLAHRSDREIGQWVTTAVSEAITFTEEDAAAEIIEHKANFDPNGWKEFERFLNDTSIIKVVESDRYQLRSYVKGVPLLLNEGAVSERYRWLFEVNADISYLDRNVSDYEDIVPENRTLKLLVQIGRSKNAKNEAGLLIERWDGKIVRPE